MDILPTGKNMVTRTPLDIRLHKINNKNGYIEIYAFYDTTDDLKIKIPITTPIPLPKEIQDIRDTITKKTIEIAGTGMDISKQPIIFNIYSQYVPNLSLIDLPGLTMVAQIDKGQPPNIKEKIEDLICSYIEHKKTIIMAIIQARSDIETDLGLHIVKKYDPNGLRTIGILTKPDLMSSGEHIGNYLLNNISKNLMLKYGYYVIKSRNSEESLKYNIIEGLKLEKEYFANHQEYKKLVYKDKISLINLTNDISKLLINSITQELPIVMSEILQLENMVIEKKIFMALVYQNQKKVKFYC